MSYILRVSLVLVTALMFVPVSQAQQESIGITGKGLKLGAAWGSLNTNQEEFDAGTAGGFTAGAFLTYSFTPHLAVQPELSYVQKGTGKGSFFGGSGYNLGYLEVPVLLKYNLSPHTRLIPSVFLGPCVSTLLSADIYYNGFFGNSSAYDVSDGMKSLDFGVVIGGEVVFRSTKSVKFLLDVRYTLGLANAIDPTKWNAGRRVVDEGDWGPFHWIDYDRPLVDEGASIKNRALTLMIGLRF